ncbi:hypothetical protein [Actinoplanes siamensis]|uniref:Secreted protein n=1 Tax=Actinoplanes siamensis TaxID=1223317 RepID=A0A919N9M4_9ACTN|nr:hypothetical protein [Actinoplanes siamensis]GIF06841.1 hypothetical protein Asi03nite_43790 [Actinoplanes siamensis]
MSGSRLATLVLAVLVTAGCTNHPATAPRPSASAYTGPSEPAEPSASATTATPPKALKPPPPIPGELSRRVVTRKDDHHEGRTTMGGSARAGQEYWLHAACTSTTPGRTLSVEIRSAEPGASGDAVVTTGLPCDGQPIVDGIGALPAGVIAVYLHGDQSDVLSAYAVVAPAPASPEG